MPMYPPFVDGKPPVITLKQYDVAEWAASTCVDSRDGGYVVVDMQAPEKVVAVLDKADHDTLHRIFTSAHETYEKSK